MAAPNPARDSEVTRDLYLRYHEPLRRYIRGMVGNAHDTEDILQQSFLRIIVGLPRYEHRGSSFEAWVYRIARNTTVDFLRRRRQVVEVEERSDPGVIPRWEATRDLLDAVGDLPPLRARVLLMRHLVGMSPDEIGREVARSPSAVGALQTRARSDVRRRLQDRSHLRAVD